MATEIKVPTLGESVTTATIARWMKHPGDAVAADEPLVELETDKVTVEVGAPAAGVLTAINFPEGAEVEVGALLGMLDGEAVAAPPRRSGSSDGARAGDGCAAPASTPMPATTASTPAVTAPVAVTVAPTPTTGRAAANPPPGVNPPPRPLGPVSRPATSAQQPAAVATLATPMRVRRRLRSKLFTNHSRPPLC